MATGSTAVSAINVAGPLPPPAGEARPTKHAPGNVPAPGGKEKPWADIPWSELTVPVAVLSVILAMILPLPSWLLDFLIAVNITLSVIVLLVGIYVSKPVDFSAFPTTLLLMTLFRLALNISSSRLILMNGNTGTAAAGHVIEAFGSFVVGGNYVIGTVIFLVLIAIQYVVINHGAVRISEVTARFSLDALPGKQMSIDSDLNAGLIDEAEAKQRRKGLAMEAEFYGAMDGASRFTQRDAVASILITAINIIAGFLIGVLQHGMELKRALATYTVLTIGDGLVTVIPALMISVSGGLIVTRANSEQRLGKTFEKQVFSNPQPLFLASAVMATMALFPGLPAFTFLALAGATGGYAWRLRQRTIRNETKVEAPAPVKDKDNIESLLKVELLSVEVGLGLVRLVEGAQSSPLLRRISAIRKQLAGDLGYLLPPVRVTDNLGLRAGEYVISIKGNEIARYEIPQGCEMAIAAGAKSDPPAGARPTREPAFGLQAWWIPATQADSAREAGFTVVDAVSVLGTHLSEIVRRNAYELFTRKDTKKVLDRVSEDNARLVEDLVPKLLALPVVQRVLQFLLRERVSIRDASSILESLSEAAQITKNPTLLCEYVRQSMKRGLVQPYLNASGELPAYLMDPAMEQALEGCVEHGEHASHLNLPPQKVRELLERFQRAVGASEATAVVLTSSTIRFFLRQLLEATFPNLAVLSHGEVPPGLRVTGLGTIR
ncbi:MAG TPA: flagellar biosynthesis protein FlhA [Bryobacteraceae bacterium]|nr:flagellar biosynthesis protein FlhA [Bryobacteraceae bacterium]